MSTFEYLFEHTTVEAIPQYIQISFHFPTVVSCFVKEGTLKSSQNEYALHPLFGLPETTFQTRLFTAEWAQAARSISMKVLPPTTYNAHVDNTAGNPFNGVWSDYCGKTKSTGMHVHSVHSHGHHVCNISARSLARAVWCGSQLWEKRHRSCIYFQEINKPTHTVIVWYRHSFIPKDAVLTLIPWPFMFIKAIFLFKNIYIYIKSVGR